MQTVYLGIATLLILTLGTLESLQVGVVFLTLAYELLFVVVAVVTLSVSLGFALLIILLELGKLLVP